MNFSLGPIESTELVNDWAMTGDGNKSSVIQHSARLRHMSV